MSDTTVITREVVTDWYNNLHLKEKLSPKEVAGRQTLVEGLTAGDIIELFNQYGLPVKRHKRPRPAETDNAGDTAAFESIQAAMDQLLTNTPDSPPADADPAPAGPGPFVAADADGDFALPWPATPHTPAPAFEPVATQDAKPASDDPGPGRRPIKSDEFNTLLGKMRGNAPAESAPPANGTKHILHSVNLRVINEGYAYPLMSDIDRLTESLFARGIKADKAIRFALRAAKLAAGHQRHDQAK